MESKLKLQSQLVGVNDNRKDFSKVSIKDLRKVCSDIESYYEHMKFFSAYVEKLKKRIVVEDK